MLKPLTATQTALLTKYSLVLCKDAPEDVRKDLRKARRQRRKLRLAAKAVTPTSKPVSAGPVGGSKVKPTKVPTGRKAVSRREMKAALHGMGSGANGTAATKAQQAATA